jgi:hypothetical protein
MEGTHGGGPRSFADAHPLAGSPSALEPARFFEREEVTRQLVQHIQRRLQGSEREPSIGAIDFQAAM